MKIRQLIIFFAITVIIILTISINSYSWIGDSDTNQYKQFYLPQVPPVLFDFNNLISQGYPSNGIYSTLGHLGGMQSYNYGWNQSLGNPSFNNYNYYSFRPYSLNGYYNSMTTFAPSQDYNPSQAEVGDYGNFQFTTYADYLPSNIMNMPPMTGDAKYIATPHAIIWSNAVYPNGIPEGPYGTLFGNDPFGNDDDD